MNPEELSNKRILITALNWGMGHVARSIGIINRLIDQQNTLFFAGNSHQISVIKEYFPVVETHILSDYPFAFKLDITFKMSLLRSSVSLIKHVGKENSEINRMIEELQLDVVISDHRYGCYSKRCTSIFLTHQLRFPLTGFWKIGNVIHKSLMKHFDFLWVPDYPNRTLSGELSNVEFRHKKVCFIGPLSRFSKNEQPAKTIEKVIVLSGPDEYALKFTRDFLETDNQFSGVIIGKKALLNKLILPTTIQAVDSSNWKTSDAYISAAKLLISACGYSTIMDLEFLDCSAYLLPTSGQMEQEYLWELHAERIGKKIQVVN
jgi:predicted glycosyltransferase